MWDFYQEKNNDKNPIFVLTFVWFCVMIHKIIKMY